MGQPSFLRKILQSEGKFNRFRKIHNYKEILEHVSRIYGESYLNEIKETYPKLLTTYDLYKRNDVFGKPRTFNYQIIGRTSPTTLRYVKTGAEIVHTFQLKTTSSVVEIGAGYGRTCHSILSLYPNITEYHIIDFPQMLDLSRAYLKTVGTNENFEKRCKLLRFGFRSGILHRRRHGLAGIG